MEQFKPVSESELLSISGVGHRKLEVYGAEFIAEILDFIGHKVKKPKKNQTHLVTYKLYKQGLSIDEISEQRQLKLPTIYSHIAKLYGDGKAINIYDFISKNDVEAIHQAKIELNDSNSLKEYYEFYNEQMDYFKIRLALSVIEKEAL